MKFSDEDKEKIRKAVVAAEKKTSGEIVPVIIKASDPYVAAYYRSALFWAFFCVSCCYFFKAEYLIMFWCFTGSIIAAFFACYMDWYKKIFITKFEMEEEFAQRAYQSFLMNGVSQTKERNGVLLYISAFERKAMIVSDTGIQKELNNSVWEEMISNLTGYMKTGAYTEGIIKTIESIGEVLSEKFPDHKDDEDELANKLIIEL